MQSLVRLLFLLPTIALADWPQAAGPNGDFVIEEDAATEWSVTKDENILWKLTLPETGQSTPVIANNRAFFTTLVPVEGDAELGKDIEAWCVDAIDGSIIWKHTIKGIHPLRLSGCFSDSSAPPAVWVPRNGNLIFTNASGGITCFTPGGEVVWEKLYFTVGRTLPFVIGNQFIFTRQQYPPEADGNFPHKYADSPPKLWTQLQALNIDTGDVIWTSECGLNMGNAILPQRLTDDTAVALVGRGGGHGPPEKPEGVSLINLSDGSTRWTLPLEGFMATQSYKISDDLVHFFHGGDHVTVDALSGEETRRVPLGESVSVIRHGTGKQIESFANPKRMVTQGSNLLVGDFHYFRSYIRPYLGRVNVKTGALEYLELPIQKNGETGELLYFTEPASKKSPGLKDQGFAPNSMKNSRGHVVMGDQRSKGSGWGHIASPTPSVAGKNLYLPVMNGTVYVIDHDAATLDESAIVAIDDLGPVGESWTRSSVSFADDRVYAHTIRELICIRKTSLFKGLHLSR